MAKKKDLDMEVLELVYSGKYNIVQICDGQNEEPYEGCTHNLYMVLESGKAKVELLDVTNPHAREDCKTYSIEYSTFMGTFTLIIWEI